MKNKNWSFIKHLMLSAMIAIVAYILLAFLPSAQEATSIGIIGGADGPTAIYIAGGFKGLLTINSLPYVVFAILLFLYKPIRRSIKKGK